MRLTRRTAVVIALICALGAGVLSIAYLRSIGPTPTEPEPPPMVAVPVLTQTTTAGTTLTESMLALKEMEPAAIPGDAVRDSNLLLGQRLVTEVRAGEPVLRSQLAAYSRVAGLSFVVPDGMRAVTIGVDDITGVGGFLTLGDRVDVLANFEAPGPLIVTRTVLQDVEVLAVGPVAVTPRAEAAPTEGAPPPEVDKPKMTSVTLAVTPAQAQMLVLSSSRGKLHLALRSRSDVQVVGLPTVDNVRTLGVDLAEPPPPEPAPAESAPPPAEPVAAPYPGGPAAGPALAPARPRPAVEVIRGTERELVTP